MIPVMLALLVAVGASSDAGSGTPLSITEWGPIHCCVGQTLYIATDAWTGGPGISLAQNAAGEWTGALAAMLREMTSRMSMGLVFLTNADCTDPLSVQSGGLGSTYAWTCTLVTTGETVSIARFATLWQADWPL